MASQLLLDSREVFSLSQSIPLLLVLLWSCSPPVEAIPCSLSVRNPCRDDGMPGKLNVTRLYVYQRRFHSEVPPQRQQEAGEFHKVLIIKTLQDGYMFAVQKADYRLQRTPSLLSSGHEVQSDPNYFYVFERRVNPMFRVKDFEMVAGSYLKNSYNQQNRMVSRMVSFYSRPDDADG